MVTGLGVRDLPSSVEVLPGTDVDGVWDRFEVFEALHHTMRICNPLTNDDFAAVVDHLAVADGDRVLDVACGYGELLMQCSTRAAVAGLGVDLSPWMLQVAATRPVPPGSSMHWVLGEARELAMAPKHDVVTCLGAEWIWHGFNGTARALAERAKHGGRVAIGAARLKDGCDPRVVSESHGRVETVAEKEAMLAAHGLTTIVRIDPDDAAWDAYLQRTKASVDAWALALPGPRTDGYVADQQEWLAARERDREIIGWSAWVAEVTG